jgi:hypothetical protein
MGGIACNGWRFWSVEGEAPPADKESQPDEYREATLGGLPKVSPTNPAKTQPNGEHRAIKRVPNQKGAAEGMTKFCCDGCMKAFEHPTADGAPAACPEGHPAIVTDAPPTE